MHKYIRDIFMHEIFFSSNESLELRGEHLAFKAILLMNMIKKKKKNLPVSKKILLFEILQCIIFHKYIVCSTKYINKGIK